MTPRLWKQAVMAVAAWCLLFPALGRAQTDMAGWERGGEYDRLYKPEAVTTVVGTLVHLKELAPMPGMTPGPVLTIRTKGGKLVAVQSGPSAFAKLLVHTLRVGDRVKIRGAYAELGGEKIFMAAKIRVNEVYEFKCRRSRDGVPYWSLSKEALIREKLRN
jgi:hypothetical protein